MTLPDGRWQGLSPSKVASLIAETFCFQVFEQGYVNLPYSFPSLTCSSKRICTYRVCLWLCVCVCVCVCACVYIDGYMSVGRTRSPCRAERGQLERVSGRSPQSQGRDCLSWAIFARPAKVASLIAETFCFQVFEQGRGTYHIFVGPQRSPLVAERRGNNLVERLSPASQGQNLVLTVWYMLGR